MDSNNWIKILADLKEILAAFISVMGEGESSKRGPYVLEEGREDENETDLNWEEDPTE